MVKNDNGIWFTKIEVIITDADYRVRWPKYGILAWFFNKFFTIRVTDDRTTTEGGHGEVREFGGWSKR